MRISSRRQPDIDRSLTLSRARSPASAFKAKMRSPARRASWAVASVFAETTRPSAPTIRPISTLAIDGSCVIPSTPRPARSIKDDARSKCIFRFSNTRFIVRDGVPAIFASLLGAENWQYPERFSNSTPRRSGFSTTEYSESTRRSRPLVMTPPTRNPSSRPVHYPIRRNIDCRLRTSILLSLAKAKR